MSTWIQKHKESHVFHEMSPLILCVDRCSGWTSELSNTTGGMDGLCLSGSSTPWSPDPPSSPWPLSPALHMLHRLLLDSPGLSCFWSFNCLEFSLNPPNAQTGFSSNCARSCKDHLERAKNTIRKHGPLWKVLKKQIMLSMPESSIN